MDNNLILTFVILGVALVVFLTDRLPADLVALLVAVALGLTGVLTPEEAFSGFSRAAVIIIMAIFILAEALRRSGVTERVGRVLLTVGGKGELRLTVVVMAAGAFLSLFMNNIAAAAVLLPAASGAAKKAGVDTSRILMPLAFGTILGGTATLLTTSNIILNSLLIDNGGAGFRITDFAWVGVPVVLVGTIYMATLGRRALRADSSLERTQAPNKDEKADLVAAYGLHKNLFKARVPNNSFLIDKTLEESTLREKFGVSVVAIERKGRKLLNVSADTHIKHGDILVFEGNEEEFKQRDVEPLMELIEDDDEWHKSDLESRQIDIVEAMLAPRSRLIGETLRDANFRDRYRLTVLAIWRRDSEITTNLADEPLQFGDALLLQGRRERLRAAAADPDLILMMPAEEKAVTAPGKRQAALFIFIGTLVLAMMIPSLTGPIMLGGALVMMLTGVLTTDQAYSAIGWRSVFLVAGMLPMGIALTKTNAAGLIAEQVVWLAGGNGHLIMMATIVAATMLLVQTVNGPVVATIMGPVAIHIGQQSGADPRSLVMAVAIAASMAFVTPLGHPVNVLVMGPGGYNFKDFVRVGLPLAVLLFFVSMAFLWLFWMG